MNDSGPLVSIVVATASAPPSLDEQLAALADQVDAPSFEVLLVGNRAGAQAREAADRWRDRLPIRLVEANAKSGASYARNVGVGEAKGHLLLFLDDDDTVNDRYVATMTKALAVHPAVGSAIDLQRLNPGWRAQARSVPQVTGLGVEPEPFAYSATLGVRRDVFVAVGPFDESLDGLAGEDIEWCIRLAQSGNVLAYVPDAVVHYRLRTRYRDVWRQGRRYGRAGERITPSFTGWWRWARSLVGPAGLLVLGRGKGARRHGAFLLGRRLGQALEHRAVLANRLPRPQTGLAPGMPFGAEPVVDRRPGLPVYLVHWRRPDWCAAAVASILRSDVPVAVTVVNNSPELATELRALLPSEVRIIETGRNLGYTGGANTAIVDWLAGNAPFAVIGAHDLHVEHDALGLLLRAAETNPEFGLLGPVLTSKLAGANSSEDVRGDQGLVGVDWLSGTGVLLRRACIENIGGFDERLGSYYEDVDLSWRARSSGWSVGLVPAAVADGLGSADPRAKDRASRNLIVLTRRHHGRRAALREWSRVLGRATRSALGSVTPRRGAAARTRSRQRCVDLCSGVAAIGVVLGRPRGPAARPMSRGSRGRG